MSPEFSVVFVLERAKVLGALFSQGIFPCNTSRSAISYGASRKSLKPENRMPRNVTMTTNFILNYVVNLLNNVGSKEELPERSSELQEELMGFYQVLESFDAMLDGIPDVQAYFVNCCDFCIQLHTEDDWKSDEVKARIPTAIHILRICRMALFIEFFWRMLHNTVATPKISLSFTQAIQNILARLDNINKFEKADIPIQQPTRSLISHYREMTSYNFSLKTMDEITASEESQMIICSPEEVFSATDLHIFEQHIKEIVIRRKSAITSGAQPIESTLRLTVFLKELSAQENSVIQLERSFIFTDMELLKPDSVFSLFGVYLTNDPTVKDLAGSLSLPITVVDGSEIIERIENNDISECAICLREPAAGEKISVLFCKHWFHQECISSWFQIQMNKHCPLCRRNS